MKKTFLLVALVSFIALPALATLPLTESTFTEIIRMANVINATNKNVSPAQTNEVFRAPDLVRTGDGSRIELTAPDKTITRVGANTVFTFAPGGRDILLEHGSILFHAPKGAGGGSVNYRGTSAAVLGTTMICVVLKDGRFKIMDLEGGVKVTLRNGISVTLHSGQMVVVTSSGDSFGDTQNFRIMYVITRLLLVVGFGDVLSSLPLIEDAAQIQEMQIKDGTLTVEPFMPTVVGLDIIFRPVDPGIPLLPPETPDRTIVPESPDIPPPFRP
jgi:hypothetical protein